ncbi:tripartite tricarboxylate transporter substrate binding protein [Microvirga sp. ACRRW]|uniref:Bug family tripartite tricarboxylate transporter substrate binding protein n=1 Tax=Microvirga sp. ACRRW TaxID=2918205 RepID=UPI001EF70BA1|nr:tripartite tricarboxylate transporter substrate-binding protein [Microvirga sp. ACRRW]MCG7393832.1 tripartite tricarboxylate transporter substrate binding protein [Microvirga sp. ACRRW]
MKFNRRTLLGLALIAGAALPSAGLAQEGSLKIMAPAAPGGGWDQTARSVAQALMESGLAKSAQVTNVPGAGGTIGIAQFVNSAKGDATQLMASGYVMVGAIITNKSPVTLDQVTPIARLTGEWQAIAVPAASPIKTMKELGELIKADPAKVTWAGGSAGGPDHILAALITKNVGADPSKTNYIAFSGGGESLGALLGGKVTAGINSLSEFMSQVKAGKLRLLAISTPSRIQDVDAPTLKESGIDLELSNWRMIVAPSGISADERARLVKMFEDLAKSDAWKKMLQTKGWDDIFLTGSALDEFVKTEQTRTGAVLKEVGLVK